jgi:hypothetical protein
LIDQLINHRIFQSRQITAAGLISGGAAPEFPLLIAWRQRLTPDIDHHVKIEIAHPVLVLSGIDAAHGHGNTQSLQITGER